MQPSPDYIELSESDATLLELVGPEATTEVVHATEVSALPAGPFRSLYESFAGTMTAVALGIFIIISIQFVVGRIFNAKRTMSDSLTTFATAMVAVLVGIYVCDLLIAGPEVMLLRESERTTIVTFIKDISLMCFSYYFGSKTSKETKESVV